MGSENIQSSKTPPPGDRVSAPGSGGGRLTGDQFAEQFRSAGRVLWCIAAGETGDRSSAEDIVQQAAVVALERLDQFDPSTSFIAWMAQIVRYTAKNESQKVRRRKTSAADPLVMDAAEGASHDVSSPGTGTPPISRFGHLIDTQNSFDDRLLRALKTLDTVARSCLLMRVVLDTPYKEISIILDIPQGTAMSHVDRARRALRTHLTASDAAGGGRERA
jgi:RNA polymerase sigma-70 factor (ECF subfamily)